MTKTMLIDAGHQEETRVVVLDNGTVAEFDFESQTRKQLRGNIYLAKVTRVEPSLQAAFVEYGGNRHGFLAFNEIHPDYYQIPVADREALLREEREAARQASDEADAAEDGEDGDGDDEDMAISRRRRARAKQYKIQEVIKRRQIMLIQVVKEERGAKGAALTTYLSLAGRYCVLMPNTARGGGVSRKITNVADRKRLKTIIQGLEVPEGMGLIIRTAGAKRTKLEIKRDYEYLLKEWDTIRETTLKSIAPALIYEEETLVKRAIRDLYGKDVDNVYVEGEEAYREAKDFIKTLSPSQAKKVQHYKDKTPLFVRFGVEKQLAAIHSPVVPLKSGGYIVINQTEALVAIDVNSGKATKERNIETTATKTNLEAADEAARQMRLRDLAGLIVIDFIDMEDQKNVRAVEKRVKDALRDDRARLQIGKMSTFGLMELSRQRRRTGVLESSTHICPSCAGLGRVRSVESAALEVLRAIETEAMGLVTGTVDAYVAVDVALFILNEKRDALRDIEARHGVGVKLHTEGTTSASQYRIESTGEKRYLGASDKLTLDDMVIAHDASDDDIIDSEEDDEDVDASDDDTASGDDTPRRTAPDGAAEDSDGRRKRRRRRRGRGRDRDGVSPEGQSGDPANGDDENNAQADSDDDTAPQAVEGDGAEGDGTGKRPRRRRRSRFGRDRGPRIDNAASDGAVQDAQASTADALTETLDVTPEPTPEPVPEAVADGEKPKRKRAPSKKALAAAAAQAETDAPAEADAPAAVVTPPEPAMAVSTRVTTDSVSSNPLDSMSVTHAHAARHAPAAMPDFPASEPVVRVIGEGDTTTRRGGWWQKKNPFRKED